MISRRYLLITLLLPLILVLLLSCTVEPESLQFVDESGPLARKTIKVVCFKSENLAQPLRDKASGNYVFDITTDDKGMPDPPLYRDACPYLAALIQVHDEPSGKPNRPSDYASAFTIYATSWQPHAPKAVHASGKVLLSEKQALTLFNVVAALEWQPSDGGGFVSELDKGLAEASAYLYDLTEGQMAFGSVGIRTGGRGWDSADLRFKTANDYRPSAYIGGIVKNPTPGKMRFVPAEVFLGRYWNGITAEFGSWDSKDASRTITHEWAHYALFLGDEYMQWLDVDNDGVFETSVPTYCTCADLPHVSGAGTTGVCNSVSESMAASAMAYHYSASEFWHEPVHGAAAALPSCANTDQILLHGESDWKTLDRWEDILGLPSSQWVNAPGSAIQAGPEDDLVQLLLDVTAIDSPSDPTYSEADVQLKLAGNAGNATRNIGHPQIYTLHGGDDLHPDRILYQGTSYCKNCAADELGTIKLLEIDKSTRIRAFADRYASAEAPGERYVYPGKKGTQPWRNTGTISLVPTTWPASLDISLPCPDNQTGFDKLQAHLASDTSLNTAPTALLCSPDSALGCYLTGSVTGAGTQWEVDFQAPPGEELPHYGVIRIHASDAGELIRWYQMQGGVGPAHSEGDAPLRDGLVLVDPADDMATANSRVVIMPVADHTVLRSKLPAGIEVFGQPFDVDVAIQDKENPGRCNQSGDHELSQKMLITYFYDQSALKQRGINVNQLVYLKYDREKDGWREIPSLPNEVLSKQDNAESIRLTKLRLQKEGLPDSAWLTTGPINQDGIFLVGYRR